MPLEHFHDRQKAHVERTHEIVDNAVLEMAVEVPMSEKVIGVSFPTSATL